MRGNGRAFIDEAEIVVDVPEHSTVEIFIGTEEKKWDESGDGPKFGAPGQFSLRLPAENLAGDFEGNRESKYQRDEFGDDFAGGGEIVGR